METEAIDNQANLVNYDNENEYVIEDLGYESEEYTEDAYQDDENNHSNGYAKRGITRLCKFRREYGKPDGVKLSVTFDALNRISGKHRALFLSFLGDMVREHIGLQILSWKKVGPEARNKLWDEITRYFDVDLTVRKLVMNRLGQLLRNFRRKLRQTYILPNQDTPSKLNEVPAKYTAILKAEDWVKSAKAKMARSKCVFPHTMGRGGYAHVKEKMKDTEDKIKEGTLQVDQGTDAMTLVLADERILLLESQLDAARREREEKELLIKSMSSKMSQTKGMVTKLKNQLATQGGQLQSTPTQLTLLDDCYKVSIDKSLVDAAFIPDVGSNGCTIVLDAVGGFVAWPKNQVVLDPKATPPSTIQMITGENKIVLKYKRSAKMFTSLVMPCKRELIRRGVRRP
ncbi:hypothetical protein Tco_0091949 [Tanacetum coccineum]